MVNVWIIQMHKVQYNNIPAKCICISAVNSKANGSFHGILVSPSVLEF